MGGASLGLPITAMLLATIATAGTLATMYLWPLANPETTATGPFRRRTPIGKKGIRSVHER
jgi:hypothetical protein